MDIQLSISITEIIFSCLNDLVFCGKSIDHVCEGSSLDSVLPMIYLSLSILALRYLDYRTFIVSLKMR